MSTSIETMMDYLRLNLPGSLDGAIELEISNVLDEFFDKTNAWVERITIPAVYGQRTYPVVAPSGRINRITRVTMPSGDGDLDNVVDIAAWMDDPEMVVLRSDPQVGAVYTVYVVIKQDPGRGLDAVPEWVYDNYRQAIQHGTLSAMMGQLAKPYSSERLAVFHGRKFQSLMAQARAEIGQKRLYRGQVWRFPANFASGSQR